MDYNTCNQLAPSVTWDPATAKGYRLPTEAEWEYAARANQGFIYAGSDSPDEVAWYSGNAEGTTHEGHKKAPNLRGLYDMSGNIWEWAWDWRADYPATAVDPIGPSQGSFRVYRGGSWYGVAGSVRVANRNGVDPGYRSSYLGFRLSRSFRFSGQPDGVPGRRPRARV